MTPFKELTKPASEQTVSWGLAAFAKSGAWEISLDETTSGPEQWRLQIEGPAVSINVPIPTPDVVGDALHVLSAEAPGGRNVEPAVVSIDEGDAITISLRADDEFRDRFFLVLHSSRGLAVHLTVTQPDLACLIDGLRQIQAELNGR